MSNNEDGEIRKGNMAGDRGLRRKVCAAALALGLVTSFLAALILGKVIRPNVLFARSYEVQGVDVSHYQGTIDWNRLEEQKVDFAFIKATEGSGCVDECFYENWKAAEKTGIRIGAYHFFSFDSSAEAQARLYIDTVGELTRKLVPVVDVEYYGDKERNPPKKETVAKELGELLRILEEHYGVRPIIYTTYKVWRGYIRNEFESYPLWIRNVYYPPDMDMKGRWVFWQYTDRAVLDGYDGAEKYIDRNVFAGSMEELEDGLVVPQP